MYYFSLDFLHLHLLLPPLISICIFCGHQHLAQLFHSRLDLHCSFPVSRCAWTFRLRFALRPCSCLHSAPLVLFTIWIYIFICLLDFRLHFLILRLFIFTFSCGSVTGTYFLRGLCCNCKDYYAISNVNKERSTNTYKTEQKSQLFAPFLSIQNLVYFIRLYLLSLCYIYLLIFIFLWICNDCREYYVISNVSGKESTNT